MVRASGHRKTVVAARLWRVAILTAAGSIGATSLAEAQTYDWQNSDPAISQPAPRVLQRRAITRHRTEKKVELAAKESAKPQGPLIIAISIAQQKMRIYDANGFYAETPVSTGMPGHPTPMGVYSVIQKHKFHRSNIYSGAPMPYMQRITWSGVAMHAGVLPGRPASHGCIRMPMAFAIKMWNWTRMGARVVIVPGEITPASFSHPLLAASKIPPQPIAAYEPKLDVSTATAITGKAADIGTPPKLVSAETRAELRPTLGYDDSSKPAADAVSRSAPSRRHAADANDALPAANVPVMPSGGSTPGIEVKTDVATSEAQPDSAKHDKAASSDDNGSAKTMATTAALLEPQREQIHPNEVVKPDLAVLSKRSGQIAVFVSRKDSKLYVRQNFSPLFDLPVTIAPSDRPLGTHVFTAQVDKNDANVLHWSVVSLPTASRRVDRRDEDERGSRRRKMAGAGPIEVKPLPAPDSPGEALDRMNLPADMMARIAEAISTGGSIIVSDQGIAAGETGEGTDFIVSLR
jgi:lipoprotein-anchoring transpeptidase ErfK/SrfK